MDKRIKPWVNKKIIEYIGEEEPTLTNFICQKVMAQSLPQNILNDVAMVSSIILSYLLSPVFEQIAQSKYSWLFT